MTRPVTDRVPPSPAAGQHRDPSRGDGMLAGLALMAGCLVATLGFLGISLVEGTGGPAYTSPLWQPMYGVLLAGSVLIVLGLPAILAVHGRHCRTLTLVGYVGVAAPLVMLNVAETSIEAFVMPYLARHGGIPAETPAGLNAFEAAALLLLIVGCVCLALAVFRARVVPLWVGVALIASLVSAFLLHGGAVAFLSDYFIYAALFCFGLYAVRGRGSAGA